MTKALDLADLLPTRPEFVLDDQTFTLRPPNALDQVWISEVFGEEFKTMLQKSDWPKIARFVYHQLDSEGQMHFRATRVKVVSESTGEVADKLITGPERLLIAIKNTEEMVRVIGAVYRAIVISNPLVEEIVKKNLTAEVTKLNAVLTEKKPAAPIGAGSSSSSRVSTAGRRKKSARSR